MVVSVGVGSIGVSGFVVLMWVALTPVFEVGEATRRG